MGRGMQPRHLIQPCDGTCMWAIAGTFSAPCLDARSGSGRPQTLSLCAVQGPPTEQPPHRPRLAGRPPRLYVSNAHPHAIKRNQTPTVQTPTVQNPAVPAPASPGAPQVSPLTAPGVPAPAQRTQQPQEPAGSGRGLSCPAAATQRCPWRQRQSPKNGSCQDKSSKGLR